MHASKKLKITRHPQRDEKMAGLSINDRRQNVLNTAREAVNTMRLTLPRESYMFHFDTTSEDSPIEMESKKTIAAPLSSYKRSQRSSVDIRVLEAL